MPVWADAKDFLTKLDKVAAAPVNAGGEWLATCQRWKRDYPAVLPRQWEENGRDCQRLRLCALFKQSPAGKQPDRGLQRCVLCRR